MVNTMETVGNNRFHSDHGIEDRGLIEFPRNILFGFIPRIALVILKRFDLCGFLLSVYVLSVKIVFDYRFVLYTHI